MRSSTRLGRIDLWGSAFLASLGLSACSSDVSDGPEGGGGATPGGLLACENPTPVVVDGVDTGYVTCASGWTHRPEKTTCASLVPRADFECGGALPEGCSTDADCSGEANNYCSSDFGQCTCVLGCTTDAQCGDGRICECGSPIGRCVDAACSSDADCSGGAVCASFIDEPGCGQTEYQCQTPFDECGGDADCDQSEQCSSNGTKKICAPVECAIGRPFVVEGFERLAPALARADWSAEGLHPKLDGLSTRTRKKLGEYWTTIGQMEHASIAAFARFSLQLLALGAPPDLIVRSQSAMADETRHTRMAFALATEYLGSPIGPGQLDMTGALAEITLEEVLRTVILEGCVGETVAAMEAREALTYVTDPTLRVVFGEIARDESEHAMLAWCAVGWLCDTFGERALAVVGEIVDDVRAGLATLPISEPDAQDEALLALGFVSQKVRNELRRGATERVVLRGLEALVCGAGIDTDLEENRMTLV